jgi:hypothetical protein
MGRVDGYQRVGERLVWDMQVGWRWAGTAATPAGPSRPRGGWLWAFRAQGRDGKMRHARGAGPGQGGAGAALQRDYGLAASAVRFIPVGKTGWCYQVTDEQGGWWFLKLGRPGAIEPAGAEFALPQTLPDACAVAVRNADRVPDTADGHPSRPQMAADSGMALDASVAMCAGHQSPGGRSFRKQRTVNPLIVPARYNFLYASSRPACGRPAAALGRQSH